MSVTIALCIIGLGVVQTAKNFYESALVWPLLILSAVFSLPSAPIKLKNRVMRLAPVGAGLVLLSQAALLLHLGPHLGPWITEAQAQARERVELAGLAARCGITTEPSQSSVVVDYLAYSVFWRTKRPVFSTYLHGWWATGIDAEAVIKAASLSGIVGQCTELPERYQATATRGIHGKYCCAHF